MRTIERHSIVFASYVFGCNVLAIVFISLYFVLRLSCRLFGLRSFFLLVSFFLGGTIHTTACFLFVLTLVDNRYGQLIQRHR